MGIILQASALPYQHLIDRGYFAVRTEVTPSGGAHPYTVVTPKGLRWLHAELRDDRPSTDMLAENRRLARENAELRRVNDVLRAASAYFASEIGPTRRWS